MLCRNASYAGIMPGYNPLSQSKFPLQRKLFLCPAKVKELSKTRVGVVGYRNTAPLMYGMHDAAFMARNELISDYPARIAAALLEGRVDVALVPVAVLANLPEYYIVSNYCIGADGDVASVALFSEIPLESLQAVYLDYQSRTSVALFRLLLREFWKKDLQLLPTHNEEYRNQITGTTGAVIIGDRALEQQSRSAYVYDLAGAWKQFTGLPFVFAVWVSLQPMPAEWQQHFDAAQAEGLGKLREVAAAQQFAAYDLYQYYTQHLRYELNDAMRAGMYHFLNMLR